MKHIQTFEGFLNEADMTKFYDGFKIHNSKTGEFFKFRYRKGVENSTVEEEAIKQLMDATKLTRGYFGVSELIKKGQYDKDGVPEFKK